MAFNLSNIRFTLLYLVQSSNNNNFKSECKINIKYYSGYSIQNFGIFVFDKQYYLLEINT